MDLARKGFFSRNISTKEKVDNYDNSSFRLAFGHTLYKQGGEYPPWVDLLWLFFNLYKYQIKLYTHN